MSLQSKERFNFGLCVRFGINKELRERSARIQWFVLY